MLLVIYVVLGQNITFPQVKILMFFLLFHPNPNGIILITFWGKMMHLAMIIKKGVSNTSTCGITNRDVIILAVRTSDAPRQ